MALQTGWLQKYPHFWPPPRTEKQQRAVGEPAALAGPPLVVREGLAGHLVPAARGRAGVIP
jgi:hypothetical protein